MKLLHLLEPEETAGNLWHRIVGHGQDSSHFPDAAVTFEQIAPQLRVFFRGLGGDGGVELKPATAEVSHHRLNRRTRIGLRTERITRARFDGDHLRLPDSLDIFPVKGANELLYFWLAAWTAVGGSKAPELANDPIERDWARLDHAHRTTCAVLKQFPGLAKHYAQLSALILQYRPVRTLPPAEAEMEAAICKLLAPDPVSVAWTGGSAIGRLGPYRLTAPPSYKTFLPVPVWGEIDARRDLECRAGADDQPGSGRNVGGDGKSRRSKRRASDEIKRKAGLFVHRFDC